MVRKALLGAAAAVVLIGSPAMAAPAEPQTLRIVDITHVRFDPTYVDARPGGVLATLKWKVTDQDTAALYVRGEIELRQYVAGREIGLARVFSYFGYLGRDFEFSFQVPQYGKRSQAEWHVTRLTATDDRGNSRVRTGNLAELDVTHLPDTAAPEIGSFGRHWSTREKLYDPGTGVTLTYTLNVNDASGFWKGRLKLTGPGGITITAPIELTLSEELYLMCGDGVNYDPYDVWCDIAVTLPPGSPDGTWEVTEIELTDNAGNTVRRTDADRATVRTTGNRALSASEFTVTPTEVDNWRVAKTVEVVMRPSVAPSTLTEIEVQGGMCWEDGSPPTIRPDGTVSIAMTVPEFSTGCNIQAIELTDSAGNLALYGTYYAAPDPGLTVRRVPDNTPPVALSVTMNPTTVPASEYRGVIGVYVMVDNTSGAPVDSFSITLYDANGVSVGGGHGGVHEDADGRLILNAWASYLPPGAYTVGLTLEDAADNYQHYGYPNGVGLPYPGGPLILTITEG